MQASFASWVSSANVLLRELSEAKIPDDKLSSAMRLANHVLGLITSEPVRDPSDIMGENILTLQNSERYDAWFQPHPFFEGTRAVFDLFEGEAIGIQAKFYWLKKRSNALMAGAVHFTPNWEDAEWSRNEHYKVGIDFFLSPDGTALHVVLSNFGKLRVIELCERLTNTDVEVLERWFRAKGTFAKDQLHAEIWESLKLQSVNVRFYRGISDAFTELHEHLRALGKADKDSKMFSSRLLGRLIFVWFIRKMSLINPDVEYFEPFGSSSADYYHTQLERLFFRTFNTPVNERVTEADGTLDLITPYLSGGLFEPRHDDWVGQDITFPEDFFTRLFDHFSDFNFTTDESTPDYEQVAIDPEMLGRVFESLLATQVEETGEQARKAKGAFYTPREVVSYMCKEAVREYLLTVCTPDSRAQNAVSKLLDTPDRVWAQASSNSLSDIPKDLQEKFKFALSELKSLDPACGSGAFPLGLLQLLLNLRLRLEPNQDPYDLKLQILQKNIFGSDIEPMAVEISRLRSWLSLLVEETQRKSLHALPNLEFNFVTANSLIPLAQADLFTNPKVQEKIGTLRAKYFAEKVPAAKVRLREEYRKLVSPDLIDVRSNQLRTFDPFETESVSSFFDAEVMFGVSNGFDIVIGNPPYVDYRKIDASTKGALASYQISNHSKMINLYLYFFEMGLANLATRGILAYISPQQYLIYENTRGLRDLIRTKRLVLLADFARVKVFDAATYTFVTILSRTNKDVPGAYLEFDQIYDLSRPIRVKQISNPISEPVDVSPYSDLVAKIESAASGKLGDLATVFCATSSAQTTSEVQIGPLFVAASNIFEWQLRNLSLYVSKQNYSPASLAKQSRMRHILTSRMTSKIRATIVEPGVYLGGKVNVVIPHDESDLGLLTAFLNSQVINFWYRQKYSMQHMQGGALPVNTTELELVPVVKNSKDLDLLRELSMAALDATGPQLESLRQDMEKIIAVAFGLSDEEMEVIKATLIF